MNDVGMLLLATFAQASQRDPRLAEHWIDLSIRIGGLIPHSMLMGSVQACGNVDAVLRCIEDDFRADRQSGPEGFVFHYQSMLSDIWVGQAYEVFRLAIERDLVLPKSDAFREIAHDLRIIRVPLEKHEIAAHNKLGGPVEFVARGAGGEDRIHVYDKADPKRSHIMPKGISSRGSVQWLAVDAAANTERWIERRALSERVLALLG